MCIRTAGRQRGVTLIELVVFIVIVSAAITGVLGVLTLTTKHAPDPLRRKQALMIAEALLEEVELAPFTFCDPGSVGADTAAAVTDCAAGAAETIGRVPASTTRPLNNVVEYAWSGLPFNGAGGVLLDANGNPIGVAGYAATLQIVPASLGGTAGGSNGDPRIVLITVRVTYDQGQVQLDGYRARYAPQVQ